jgi:hypothetical protein
VIPLAVSIILAARSVSVDWDSGSMGGVSAPSSVRLFRLRAIAVCRR